MTTWVRNSRVRVQELSSIEGLVWVSSGPDISFVGVVSSWVLGLLRVSVRDLLRLLSLGFVLETHLWLFFRHRYLSSGQVVFEVIVIGPLGGASTFILSTAIVSTFLWA